MAKEVLILGAKGMLGRSLAELFTKKKYKVTAWDLAQIDITDPEQCREKIPRLEVPLIINAAAYTNVDGAEKEQDTAMKINGEAAGYLAEIAEETGAKLVHYSTDYVFDGKSKKPYNEDDKTNPISAYGKSKLKGEENILKTGSDFIIIRTEWLFGKYGKNFVRSIINAASQKNKLEVVNDQKGAPTFTVDLAEATLNLITKSADGIVNFTSSGETTWFDFASLILRELNIDTVDVAPIKSSKLKLPAKRPANSLLSLDKYKKITGKTPPEYSDALNRYLKLILLK